MGMENKPDYVRAFDSILEVAEKYAHLWDEGNPLSETVLIFSSGFIDQDEYLSVGVNRSQSGFCFSAGKLGKELTSEEVVERLDNLGLEGYPSPKYYMDSFKKYLKDPLGEYLADRELDGLDVSAGV